MNPLAFDIDYLKLTVDEKENVWYLDGDKMPCNSNCHVNEFISLPIINHARNVRVVGSRLAANLLINLFAKKCKNELDKLEICSPLCCEPTSDKQDPDVVLYNMRTFCLSPSLSGWHEFGPLDYPSYAIAYHFSKSNTFDDYVKRILTLHPVWPSLSFIKNIDLENCSRLIGLILDPRWYIDTYNDPNRGSKLEQYLGLNPRTQSSLVNKKQTWRHDRCKLVMKCWKSNKPNKEELCEPENFLWRIYHARSNKGDLCASKEFVRFLRLTWLNSIVCSPKANRLFVPDYFFANKEESEAYKRHLEKFSNIKS